MLMVLGLILYGVSFVMFYLSIFMHTIPIGFPIAVFGMAFSVGAIVMKKELERTKIEEDKDEGDEFADVHFITINKKEDA